MTRLKTTKKLFHHTTLRRAALMVVVWLATVTALAQTAGQPAEQPADRAAGVALKTNLLYDAVLVPNIGIEMSLGKRWTLAGDWFYTWFSSDNRHRYWQGYGGYVTLRRYFGSPRQLKKTNIKTQNFSGHHLGIYALGLTYDVEWGGRGYQADHFGFGAGVEYGYSLPIGHCLDLDFSIGVGFQDGEYKTYDPVDDHYVWHSTSKRHWWGPTKAEVTLKWKL